LSTPRRAKQSSDLDIHDKDAAPQQFLGATTIVLACKKAPAV